MAWREPSLFITACQGYELLADAGVDVVEIPDLAEELVQLGTLHHYEGERSLQSIMAEYVDALPSGSYVAISNFLSPETNPELSQLAGKIEQVLRRSP